MRSSLQERPVATTWINPVDGKDLSGLAQFDSCAVVGSSDQLLKGEFGAEIDNHTAIIRCNDAPTKGFEAKVGSFTTLRIQNLDMCNFGGQGELCYPYSLNSAMKCFRKPKGGCKPLFPTWKSYNYVQWYWQLHRPPKTR